MHCVEHFDRGLAGSRRDRFHAPQERNLGAMRRIREIAVRREKIRHAADLAPAHRIGLAGQRQWGGAGPADLPGREMQID